MLAVLYPLLGYHYIRMGKFQPAQTAFLTGQEILQTNQIEIKPGFGTDPVIGYSLLALVKGDYSAALQSAEAGREASIVRKDPLNFQIACYVLANITFALGKYQAALTYVQQGLRSIEVTGNLWMKGQFLSIQGEIVQAQNRYSLARQIYREGYQIKQELHDPEGEARALYHMATIDLLQGQARQADQLYRKSLEIYLRIDDPGGLGNTYAGLGDSALAQADFSTACRYYALGLEIAIQIHWLPLIISLLTGISELFLRAGRVQQSAILLNQVLAHPAITEDARTRARQILERVYAQLPSPSSTTAFLAQAPEKADEDLSHTSRILLVELNNLTLPDSPADPHPNGETASTRYEPLDPLTARETDILRLIAEGKSNRQIATAFVLSEGTVKWYSQQIYQKLGVANRAHAVARAREIHLLE